jgi:hypothetical protein
VALTVLLIAATVTGYGVHLYVHPFGLCRRCDGSGKNRGSSRKAFGTCKRCIGTGRRQRFGSRALHRSLRSWSSYRSKDK